MRASRILISLGIYLVVSIHYTNVTDAHYSIPRYAKRRVVKNLSITVYQPNLMLGFSFCDCTQFVDFYASKTAVGTTRLLEHHDAHVTVSRAWRFSEETTAEQPISALYLCLKKRANFGKLKFQRTWTDFDNFR